MQHSNKHRIETIWLLNEGKETTAVAIYISIMGVTEEHYLNKRQYEKLVDKMMVHFGVATLYKIDSPKKIIKYT